MFCSNKNKPVPLFDSISSMPKYLKKILDKSWAGSFREKIFPYINEERFAILYSDNHATRPNAPVNVLFSLLIIKELLQLTDEELIGSLHFDQRFHYALWTTEYEKQPVSINTLTNFRRRLYEYYKETDIDLVQEEVEELSERIVEYLQIDNKNIRMDSCMVSSSCKKLSRLELVYSVNAKFVKALKKINEDVVPENCKAYLEKEHKNQTLYQTRDNESESKLEILLKHTSQLYTLVQSLGNKYSDMEECLLLERMLKEQTDENDNVTPISAKEISATSLQNPTDPDATYRKKYSDNVGYVANLVQAYGDKKQVITHYDLKENTYSDVQFAFDVVEKLGKNRSEDESTQILVDGGYYSYDVDKKAKESNIEIIPGELSGRKPDKDKISYGEFEVSEDSNTIIKCPANQTPAESYFSEKKSTYTAKFTKQQCEQCPLMSNCPIKKQKKLNVVRFSKKRYQIDQLRLKMDTKEYSQITRARAGVEGAPSVLRRRYQIDKMPIRGLVRSKIWFGFKIMASNVKSLVKGTSLSLKRLGFSFNLVISKDKYRSYVDTVKFLDLKTLLFVG